MTTRRADLALPGLELEHSPASARRRADRLPRAPHSGQVCFRCARWLTRELVDRGEIAHPHCFDTLDPPSR